MAEAHEAKGSDGIQFASAIELLKISSTGTLTYGTLYNPAASGQLAEIAGLELAGTTPVVTGFYTVSSSPVGFAAQFSSAGVRGTTLTYTGVEFDDTVMDGSSNVYASAVSSSGQALYKFSASGTLSYTWDASNTMPTGRTFNSTGCLTLDGSGNLNYAVPIQVTSTSANEILDWSITTSKVLVGSNEIAAPDTFYIDWTIIDSSGNLVVLGDNATSNYELTAITAAGSFSWRYDQTISGDQPTMVIQDHSGDFLVSCPRTISGITYAQIDDYSSTGTFNTTFQFSNSPTYNDWGYYLFPTSTNYTYYLFGIGDVSGSYYPFNALMSSSTPTWKYFQT